MEHTNEELVKLIQQGDKGLIPQLWGQVRRFICRQAKRRMVNELPYLQDLEEDLINEAYFGFLDAVYAYRDNQGASFLHYLALYLKTSFNTALGVRTKAGREAPHRNAVRLDMPMDGAEDLTLGDVLMDPLAEEAYRQIEDEDFWEDVHKLLREAIDQAASGDVHRGIVIMLEDGVGIAEACRRIGLDYSAVRTRLQDIRRLLMRTHKRKCQEMGLFDYFRGSRGVGLAAYRYRNFTSVTEDLAVWKADEELRQRRMARLWEG